VLLYVIAAYYYPGGSQADISSRGFSWINNYWCNLLDTKALNGYPNRARPVAIFAMTVLCLTLTVFWYNFPGSTDAKNWIKRSVKCSGLLSVLFAALLGFFEHDKMTNAASLFGIIAVVGAIYILGKQNWQMLFWLGIINVLLVGVNNLFYYADGLLKYLPVVQKLTFAIVLLWMWLITRKVSLQRI
jgi:hypothetical protein